MKVKLLYMLFLIFPIIGFGQKNVSEPIEYIKSEIFIKILDTLYLPLDTTPTIIRFEMINNSSKLIELGEDFDEEEFADIGWERVVYETDHYFKGDTLVLPRVTNLILIPLRPQHHWEHSIPFLLPFHSFYRASKRYRITKPFNFEGEEQKYYIWDELVVRERKE